MVRATQTVNISGRRPRAGAERTVMDPRQVPVRSFCVGPQ